MKKIKWGQHEIDNIVSLVKSGQIAKEIAIKYNVSTSTINKLLKLSNYKRENPKSHFKIKNKKLIDEICNYYIQTNSIKNTSIKFKLSKFVVTNILKNNKIKIIRNRRLYKVDEDYFKKINTEDKAYFLGWMVSDGNVYGNCMNLSCKDKEILELFKKHLNFEGKVYNDKNMYIISIHSKKLVEDLSKYGVVPRKSNKTYFPNIPEYLWHHFIRGVFDGDGCIYINKIKNQQISIAGNIDLLIKIREVIAKNCEVKLNSIYKTKTTYSITWGGESNLIKIRNWLYKDSTLFLKRKRYKFFTITKKYIDRTCYICKKENLAKGYMSKGMCKNCYSKEFVKIKKFKK